MKRALLSSLGFLLVGGGVAVGQWFCNPCLPPPTPEPPCYATFWTGEPILVQVVVPWSIFCCNPCATNTMILGWSVEAFEGGVVFSYTYPVPVASSTEIIWDQHDFTGAQVAAGFYKIVVGTTRGDVVTYVKIEAVPGSGCGWREPAPRACGISLCDPYLKVSRAPVACQTCCDPCCNPCFFPWIFPFLFIFGK